jgi:hypothetical protein
MSQTTMTHSSIATMMVAAANNYTSTRITSLRHIIPSQAQGR